MPNVFDLTFQVYFLRPAEQNKSEMQAVMANLRSQLDTVNDRLYGVRQSTGDLSFLVFTQWTNKRTDFPLTFM